MRNNREHGPRLVPSAAHGFTLIELMVVLVIMAALSSAIVPSMVTTARANRIEATGGQLCELIKFASMSAITRHRAVDLNLDAGRARCWVSIAVPDLPWREKTERTPAQTLAAMALPEGLTLNVSRGAGWEGNSAAEAQWERLTFRANGQAESATIQLVNPAGEQFDVEIVGMTGEVRVRGRQSNET